MTAIWTPFWYELDQPIRVGQEGDFDFFVEPPAHIRHEGRRVFYHGGWSDSCRNQFTSRRVRIASIAHPQLGAIQSIDTNGLVYVITLADSRVVRVEAEETPGSIEIDEASGHAHGHDSITDWRFYVECEPLP